MRFSIIPTLFPRRVCQNSEVVIENVSAMYGAGFSVEGDVLVSVGPSVYFVAILGQTLNRM